MHWYLNIVLHWKPAFVENFNDNYFLLMKHLIDLYCFEVLTRKDQAKIRGCKSVVLNQFLISLLALHSICLVITFEKHE